MRLLSRLLYGRHYMLFEHGFPLTARQAWGRRLQGDPDLSSWLADKALFEAHGNGVVLFAPRLLEQAKLERNIALGRLKGIVRWRHALNCYAHEETSKAIAVLRTIGDVLVGGGWSDVACGRASLAAAHLGQVFVALEPYDRQQVAALLKTLGWEPDGETWRRHILPNQKSKLTIRLSIGSDLGPVAWPMAAVGRGDLFHAQDPSRILLLADRALKASRGHDVAQLLDRMVEDITDLRQLDTLKAQADQLQRRNTLDEVLSLVERLCVGRFEKELPKEVQAAG